MSVCVDYMYAYGVCANVRRAHMCSTVCDIKRGMRTPAMPRAIALRVSVSLSELRARAHARLRRDARVRFVGAHAAVGLPDPNDK